MNGENKTKKDLSEDFLAKDLADAPKALQEGIDYILENGYFVFTRDYLLRRGHCCGSGCRNCPYGEQNTK